MFLTTMGLILIKLYAWGKGGFLSLFKGHINSQAHSEIGFAFINLKYASPESFLAHTYHSDGI